MQHKKYGGSSAARQIMCPGWTDEAAKSPSGSGSSIYAEEGTALHDCMEELMTNAEAFADDFLGRQMNGITMDEGHIERLDMALTAYEFLCKDHNFDDYMAEISVELTADIGGTCDVLLWGEDHVAVIDWKFGQGVEVSPIDNMQGLFYAMCARHETPTLFEGKKLLLVIIQPLPSKSGAETLKVWEVPANRLDTFATAYMKSINAKGLNAGAWCQFCPGSATCPERSGEAQAALQADPEQLELLAENLTMALKLKDWIKAVETMSHEQMDIGMKIPGYKLVDKRATRKWSDEEEVRSLLAKKRSVKMSDYMAPAKLKSVAQLEKVKSVDMSVLSDYITKTSTGTTLAAESDPREEALSEGALIAALKLL